MPSKNEKVGPVPQGRGEAHWTFHPLAVDRISSERVEVGFLYPVALAGVNTSGYVVVSAGVITTEDGGAGA